MKPIICFIGSGNMAKSMIGGLLSDGYSRENIIATDRNLERCKSFSQMQGIKCESDNITAVKQADIIILAIKPQQLRDACLELKDIVQKKKPLIISIAAGILTQDIDYWLGKNISLIRGMPNTPALIKSSATALFANVYVTVEQKNQAESIFRSIGLIIWVKSEEQINAVTALSGSGPAYFFLFMEYMINSGIKLGLDKQDAHLLTLQTAIGASKMALESMDTCNSLRKKVTSPKGTTEQAIKVFQEEKLEYTIYKAMQSAYNRSISLAKELGDKTNVQTISNIKDSK